MNATNNAAAVVAPHQENYSSRAVYRRVLISCLIGNTVEWYDNGVYAVVAAILAGHFFPSDDPVVSLMAAFGGFALGYLVRPIAGTILGQFADTVGRKRVLVLTILLMSVGTAGIGLLPTYERIGVLAPLLLLLMRVVQSVGASGEFTTAAAFLLEHGPENRKYRLGAYTAVGAFIGFALAALVAVALTLSLGDGAFRDWGWRVAFLLAAPLAAIGFFIRKRLDDTPEFRNLVELGAVPQRPLREALTTHWRRMLLVGVIASGNRATTFALAVYLAPALSIGGFGQTGGYLLAGLANLVVCAFMVPSGMLADRFDATKVMMMGYGFAAVTMVPVFLLIGREDFWLAMAALVVFAIGLSLTMPQVTTLLISAFPPDVRATASGLTYNVVTTAVGATMPIIGVWLTAHGGPLALPAYLAALCLISAACVFLARRQVNSARVRYSLSSDSEI